MQRKENKKEKRNKVNRLKTLYILGIPLILSKACCKSGTPKSLLISCFSHTHTHTHMSSERRASRELSSALCDDLSRLDGEEVWKGSPRGKGCMYKYS